MAAAALAAAEDEVAQLVHEAGWRRPRGGVVVRGAVVRLEVVRGAVPVVVRVVVRGWRRTEPAN